MNRSFKGAIAIAAAGALLLGGSSSLAYWNSAADISPTAISAGNLSLILDSGAWHRVIPGAVERTAVQFDPTVDKIVPGDVVIYTVNATVSGSGSTLKAKLTADLGKLTGTETLPRYITTTLTVAGQSMAAAEEPPAVILGVVNGTTVYPVTVQFTFDPVLADGFKGQGGTAQLSGMKLKLTQIP